MNKKSNRSSSSRLKIYARMRGYWNKVNKRTAMRGNKKCVKYATQKYASRPGPPYPANECCGMTKTGNDGYKYMSKPKITGICAWTKKINSV